MITGLVKFIIVHLSCNCICICSVSHFIVKYLEAQTLRDQVQPQSESVLQSTEQAFRQGRTSYLEYANAQQQLLEVRRDAVAAAAEYHALLIEIERLTGASLSADDAKRGEDP